MSFFHQPDLCKGLKNIILCLMILFITGCATAIKNPAAGPSDQSIRWKKQISDNSAVTSWQLKGKIGIKTGRRGGSATLKWLYIEDNQEIEMYGPFGGGRVKIFTSANSATLKDTKGRVIEGQSAEEVLYKRLGWQVPFEELIFWCRGLPNEGATDIEIDDQGRLKSLKQGIWHVEYQEYRQIDNLFLPRKLTITALPGKIEVYDDDGDYLGDELSVKVILKRWLEINTG